VSLTERVQKARWVIVDSWMRTELYVSNVQVLQLTAVGMTMKNPVTLLNAEKDRLEKHS
jgi:hypothetical protein